MKVLVLTLAFLLMLPLTYAKFVELKISAKFKKGDSIKAIESKIITELGGESTVSLAGLGSFKMNLVADSFKGKTEDGNPESTEPISFDGKIFRIENNREKLIANPKFITLLGRKATFKTGDANGDFLELAILPVKFSQK